MARRVPDSRVEFGNVPAHGQSRTDISHPTRHTRAISVLVRKELRNCSWSCIRVAQDGDQSLGIWVVCCLLIMCQDSCDGSSVSMIQPAKAGHVPLLNPTNGGNLSPLRKMTCRKMFPV